MPRMTVAKLRELVEELLDLQETVERAKALEAEIKAEMAKKGMVGKGRAVVIQGKGRAWLTTSPRTTITPELARRELGLEMAAKVIRVRESVSNDIVEAFVSAGEIQEGVYARLLEQADRREVASLYVRPLK